MMEMGDVMALGIIVLAIAVGVIAGAMQAIMSDESASTADKILNTLFAGTATALVALWVILLVLIFARATG